MTTLRMKGVRCASLEDFRKNFEFTNAKDYLRQGRLSRWVRDLGKNDLADELDKLKDRELSDQALLADFADLFKLRKKVVRMPKPEAPVAKEKPLPAVREVTVDPGAALRNVDAAGSYEMLGRYLKNLIVLRIIREIVSENPPGTGPDSVRITAGNRFVADLGFGDARFDVLARRLNERLAGTLRFESVSWGLDSIAIQSVGTVGAFLDRTSISHRLNPFINNETIHLLGGNL